VCSSLLLAVLGKSQALSGRNRCTGEEKTGAGFEFCNSHRAAFQNFDSEAFPKSTNSIHQTI
jgi:hypothetical protein